MAHPQQPGAQAFPQGQGNSPNRAGTAGVTCSDAEHELTRSFVNALKEKGIKLLALDFDNTFINTHTRGFWDKPVDELAKKVRPCMRDLLLLAARDKDLKVCIVTFFKDEQIIRELLQHVYNSDPVMEGCLVLQSPNPVRDHRSEKETEDIVKGMCETLLGSDELHYIAFCIWDSIERVISRVWGEIHCSILYQDGMDFKTFHMFTEALLQPQAMAPKDSGTGSFSPTRAQVHGSRTVQDSPSKGKKKSPKKASTCLPLSIASCCGAGNDSSTASETEIGVSAQEGPTTSKSFSGLPNKEEKKGQSLCAHFPAGGGPAENLAMESSTDDSGGKAEYSQDQPESLISVDGSGGKAEYPQGQPGSSQRLNESENLSGESHQQRRRSSHTSPSLSSSDESGAEDSACQAESQLEQPGPCQNLQGSGDEVENQLRLSQKGKGKAQKMTTNIKAAAVKLVKSPKRYLAKKQSRVSSATGTGNEVKKAEDELGSQFHSISQHGTEPPEESSASEGASILTDCSPGSSGGPAYSGDQPGPSRTSQGESSLSTQQEADTSRRGSTSMEWEGGPNFSLGEEAVTQAGVAAQLRRRKAGKGVKRWREGQGGTEGGSPSQRPRTDSGGHGDGSSGMEQDETKTDKSDSSVEEKLATGMRDLDSPTLKKGGKTKTRESSSSFSD